MTENRQKDDAIIGERKGVPIYNTNPSIPNANAISKRRKVQFGDEQRGFVLDQSSGEVLSVGGAGFYQFEEVDDTKFVKMFLAGIKQAVGLSKSGLAIFEIVYNQLQQNPGDDKVMLSFMIASEHIDNLNERTYHRGLRELLDNEFLYLSASPGVYFVNIRFMFNGDRLAFVKGYQRKGSSTQKELALEDTQE